VHGKVLVPATAKGGQVELHCGQESHFGFVSCAHVGAQAVEAELIRAFVEALVLDEQDEAALAQLAQQRGDHHADGALAEVRRQLEEQRQRYERAKRLALAAPDLAADLLGDLRSAKRAVQDLEQRVEELQRAVVPAVQAWQSAERAIAWAERIRTTFPDWPRAAQARVLALALDDAALGWVSRHVLGLWMRWHGGGESHQRVTSKMGKKVPWTREESEALRLHFGTVTWDALRRMFPGRSVGAITQQAGRLGLTRPADGGRGRIPPVIFPAPQIANTMAAYGFSADEFLAGTGVTISLPNSLGA
jgi:hypothetical protein